MKIRPCPVCGTGFRRGRFVMRLTLDGATRQRVCLACARLATPVLASDAPSRCEHCGKNLATFCKGCVAEVMRKREIA